jgi:hypothetical protein
MPIDQADLERLWFSDAKLSEIAAALGVTVSVISKARQRYGLPRRCAAPLDDDEGEIPDPQTIRLRCAEVRTAWDFVTYKLRWQGEPAGYYD